MNIRSVWKKIQAAQFWGCLAYLFFPGNLFAQDPTFTQFYASPLYLNPGFTGSCEQYRATMLYRRHWVGLAENYETNLFSFDHYLIGSELGAGLQLMNDRIRGTGLSSNAAHGFISYGVRLAEKWNARAGLSMGYVFRSVNFSRFLFRDQIDNNFTGPSADLSGGQQKGFADISAGIVAYSKQWWVGGAVAHLNRPNQSLGPEPERLPMRYNLQAGARFQVGPGKTVKSIAPAILYQLQGGFSQLDLGTNIFFNPLFAGVWYRGMPIRSGADELPDQDALNFVVGIRQGALTIGYSYDLTISGLGSASGGSHEIAISYMPAASVKFRRRAKDKRFIDCPAF